MIFSTFSFLSSLYLSLTFLLASFKFHISLLSFIVVCFLSLLFILLFSSLLFLYLLLKGYSNVECFPFRFISQFFIVVLFELLASLAFHTTTLSPSPPRSLPHYLPLRLPLCLGCFLLKSVSCQCSCHTQAAWLPGCLPDALLSIPASASLWSQANSCKHTHTHTHWHMLCAPNGMQHFMFCGCGKSRNNWCCVKNWNESCHKWVHWMN